MHIFLYPEKDTFITNISGYETSNFGLNEVLRVGVPSITSKQTLTTKSYPVTGSISNLCITNFSGSIYNATVYGTASNAIVSISSSTVSNVTTSFFNGTLTGSYLSSSYSSSNFTGSLSASFSGSFSGIFSGSVSGSIWSDYLSYINGKVLNFTGKIYSGNLDGYQVLNQQNVVVITKTFANRALLQFDLTTISQSISSGGIVNPTYKLIMKCAREENLPIRYSLIAYPLYEGWDMGDGYYFDGGSSKGASWSFRDRYSGSLWAMTGSSYLITPSASQAFNYQAGDVSMDVTNIANAWINNTISNCGLVVMTSEETNPTSSGMSLYFFSQDSNTIYSPYLDVGWNDTTIVTGSLTTSSISIAQINEGISGSITTGSTFSMPFGGISGMFNGDAYLTRTIQSIGGPVVGYGTLGLIKGLKIVGTMTGSSTLSSSWQTGPCGKTFDAYIITGSFSNGTFSGSTFNGWYTNYQIISASLSGSWPISNIYSHTVTIPLPSGIYPFAYAYVSGSIFNGKALGTYTVSSSTSSSFNGQFVDGIYIGGTLALQLTGSVYTSSYSYTGSVIMASSSLQPMQVSNPFITVVKIPEKVKNNQIIKVKVFGREQYPLKNFQRLPQFSQFLTPQYLPSGSYYAIKDNQTEEIILDFDDNTRISCDLNGSYFMLDTSGLPQERYFKVLIKIEQSSSVYIIDDGSIFKVIR